MFKDGELEPFLNSHLSREEVVAAARPTLQRAETRVIQARVHLIGCRAELEAAGVAVKQAEALQLALERQFGLEPALPFPAPPGDTP